MLFDAHTHLNNESFTEEKRAALAKEIKESDVSYIMDTAFDLESSNVAVNNSKKYDFCYCTVGFHPHDAEKMDEISFMLLEGLTKKDKVQAIGEIGLDFFKNISSRATQIDAFRKQIGLANKLKLPVVIHSRDADQEVMDILKEEKAFSDERKSWFPKRNINGEEVSDARVLLHCFSGSKELAEQYFKLGATISIAGPVTFKNNKKTIEVVEAIPIEAMTIETDSPYLTPEPHRGEKNKSQFVAFVCDKVAQIKGMTYEDVARITCENAKRFFNIE